MSRGAVRPVGGGEGDPVAACEWMLGVPGVSDGSALMLRRLLREFGDVKPLARRDPIPVWQPTRLNSRYHSALRLGELVLRAASFELAPGDVAATGLLLDMPLLFEEFVTKALGDAVGPARYQLGLVPRGDELVQPDDRLDDPEHAPLAPQGIVEMLDQPDVLQMLAGTDVGARRRSAPDGAGSQRTRAVDANDAARGKSHREDKSRVQDMGGLLAFLAGKDVIQPVRACELY